MAMPSRVNAYGRYLLCRPRPFFKVKKLHLKNARPNGFGTNNINFVIHIAKDNLVEISVAAKIQHPNLFSKVLTKTILS